MRTSPRTRLLSISLLVLLSLYGLPAAAQDLGAGGAVGGSAEGDAGTSDEVEDDGRVRPNRGSAHLDDGEVGGHLAPAVSEAGQRVVIHAVARLADDRGQGGRPDHAGNPHGDEADDDEADDQEVEDGTDDPEADDPEADGGADDAADGGDDAGAADDQGAEDGDDADAVVGSDAVVGFAEADVAADADDQAEDDLDADTDVSSGPDDSEDTDDAAEDTDDGAGDDSEDSDEDAHKCVTADVAGASFAADDDSGDDLDDDSDGRELQPCDVTFTVDFGDGTPVQVMRPTKVRGGDGTRRALGDHEYAADGEYAVTITAIPLEGEQATLELVAQVGAGTARLEGDSRIETAIRISQDTFPENGSAGSVLIARADQFADALAASTLAFVQQGPVLLTASDQVPDAVLDEVDRVLADGGTVVLLGGPAAISAEAEAAIAGLGVDVVRLAGEDRIATAIAIAQRLLDGGLAPAEVVIASAQDFPDALAGAAYAAANDALVLLTSGDALDPRVVDLITGLGAGVDVVVVGGESAVSPAVLQGLVDLGNTVTRVAGATRFATAALLAERGYDGGDTVVLATGANYPDALAGAAYAAANDAPILLVGDTLPVEAAAFLTAHADMLDTVVVLGGEAAVPEAVVEQAEDLVDADPEGGADEIDDEAEDEAGDEADVSDDVDDEVDVSADESDVSDDVDDEADVSADESDVSDDVDDEAGTSTGGS